MDTRLPCQWTLVWTSLFFCISLAVGYPGIPEISPWVYPDLIEYLLADQGKKPGDWAKLFHYGLDSLGNSIGMSRPSKMTEGFQMWFKLKPRFTSAKSLRCVSMGQYPALSHWTQVKESPTTRKHSPTCDVGRSRWSNILGRHGGVNGGAHLVAVEHLADYPPPRKHARPHIPFVETVFCLLSRQLFPDVCDNHRMFS